MAATLSTEFRKPNGHTFTEIALIPSGGGCYEITLNGELLYSKLQTGQHITDDEVVTLVRKHLSSRRA